MSVVPAEAHGSGLERVDGEPVGEATGGVPFQLGSPGTTLTLRGGWEWRRLPAAKRRCLVGQQDWIMAFSQLFERAIWRRGYTRVVSDDSLAV